MISGVSASVRRDFGVLSSPSTWRVRAADEPSRFLIRFTPCVTATAPASQSTPVGDARKLDSYDAAKSEHSTIGE